MEGKFQLTLAVLIAVSMSSIIFLYSTHIQEKHRFTTFFLNGTSH